MRALTLLGSVQIILAWATLVGCNASSDEWAIQLTIDQVAQQIVVDEKNVYWVTGDCLVMKVSKNGGTPSVISPGYPPTKSNSECAIAPDGNLLYILGGPSQTTAGDVPAVRVGDGRHDLNAITQEQGSSEIVVDATGVYFQEDGIVKMPVGGGPAVTLAPTQSVASAIALSNHTVFWAEDGSGIEKEGRLSKVSINGGDATVLADGLDLPLLAVANSKSVFFADFEGLKRISVNGGELRTVVPEILIENLALDATFLYWASSSSSHVLKMSLQDGSIATVVEKQGARGLAVDATSIYYGDPGRLTLVKRPK